MNPELKRGLESLRTDGPTSEIAEYITQLNCSRIGETVRFGSFSKGVLTDITAVCRRCFRKEEVIVYVDLDEDEDYEKGIVFTEDAIVVWTDSGDDVEKIEYAEITDADFDENEVIIYHGSTTRIDLGDDAEEEGYSRNMYSFIMDILEFLQEDDEFEPEDDEFEEEDELYEETTAREELPGRNKAKWIREHIDSVLAYQREKGEELLACVMHVLKFENGYDIAWDEKMEQYLMAGDQSVKGLIEAGYDFMDVYCWSMEDAE